MADKEQKDRKAEIERRKKRLEELRQAREQKKKEVKDKEVRCLFLLLVIHNVSFCFIVVMFINRSSTSHQRV